MTDDSRYRLPHTARPTHYRLLIAPDLESATFDGTAIITVDVREPVTEIVCNAIELEIHSAMLRDTTGHEYSGTVTADPDTERVTVAVASPLAAGSVTLTFTYSGLLNDKLRGFYRSTFTDNEGAKQVIAATQFEATDARRAFPCWDEPEAKATFEIELLVGDGLVGLSNTAAVSERPTADGRRWITFARTMKLSTYLAAWVVGPLELSETVDVDGVPLRVACTPGRSALAGFALEVGSHALRYFTAYFGIPYPGDKLDLVAIPDFAFGAMENLGCVTFRETALLADPQTASREELERIAEVVSHEIAHMWFGDLVTMRWWNGIWLNEAFATFMEVKCVEAFRPDWKAWVSFSVARSAAMAVDGLASTRPVEFPVVSPDEAEAMFDLLTYQKGGAVLRMLETYLGAERFRDGIRSYLETHRYANTETTDLWDALEATSGEPVRALMDTWILQGGHPEVAVAPGPDGTIELSQRRFRYQPAPGDGEARWHVPVLVRAGDTHHRALLTGATLRMAVADGTVIVNDGGWGFFRTRYEAGLLDQVTAEFAGLGAIERFNLLSDTWSSVLAGSTPLPGFLAVVGRIGDEPDDSVWQAALGPLDALHRMGDTAARAALAGFVQRLVGPAFARLGWQAAPGEGDRVGTLRAALLGALGTIGADEAVRHRAATLHTAHLSDRQAVAPDLLGAVVSVTAWNGGPAEYELFWERARRAMTPQEEVRYLFALPRFPDPELLRRTLALTLSEIRSQNAPFVVSGALANRWAGPLAWTWLKEHWSEVMARFPDNATSRMLDGVVTLTEPVVAEDVRAFLAAHPVAHAQRLIDQNVERLGVNTALRQREAARLATTFAAS
jgi:puromycin-sensitive aminopeptidase